MASRANRRSRATRAQPKSIWQRGKWWFVGGGAVAVVAVLVVLTTALSGVETTGGEVQVSPNPQSPASASSASVPDIPLVFYQGQDLLDSTEPRFSSLLGEKPLVVNYWASNCPPCRAEMPGFEKVWRKYQDRVIFMGLDVGRFIPGYGDQQQSQKELKELGITYVAGSPENIQGAYALGVQGFPSTDFITADGKLFKRWGGTLNESKLTEIIDDLLSGSTAVSPEVGEAIPTLPAVHDGPYSYNTRPPTSGNHLENPGPYGLSSSPLVAEAVVHNMEHGAVVIWYQPGEDLLAAQVAGLVSELGSECLVAGPPTDMDYRVAATSWGRLLGLDAFDAESIRSFVSAYRGQGPEAGVCFR